MSNNLPVNDSNLISNKLPIPATENLPSAEFQTALSEWQGQEEISLRDYFHVISRRKWLIITVFALVLLSALIFTLASTRIYKASATIEVSPESAQVTKFEEVLGSNIKAREFYETQVELICSKTLIKRVIEKLNLAEHPVLVRTLYGDDKPGAIQHLKDFIKSLLPGYKDKTDALVSKETLKQQKLFDYMAENLLASPSRKSMLIEVSFASPDPKLSQVVVNTLVDEFIAWKMEQKFEASRMARNFLMVQIDQAKINLEKAEEDLNRFAKEAGIVSLDAKLNSIYRQLEELNSAITAAEADMITKMADYQQALGDGTSNLPQALKSILIANLKDKYAQLQSEYEDLKITFHDDYPSVKNLKARMDSIAARIKKEEYIIFRAIQNEYFAAQRKVAALKERIEEQKELVLDLNERATQYSIMTREVDTNKAIYQSLLERVKEIESMSGISTSNIQKVDLALLPIFPVKPNVKLTLLFAIVVGLLGGLGCAFLAEYIADTITDPEEINDRYRIPLLGMIPQIKSDGSGIESTFVRNPRTMFSEAVRSSRVSIQLSGADKRCKSFLVTSGIPNEGKTTIAASLALSFAAAEERVILIDVDLRKPRLHQVFTPSTPVNGNGLSSFLAAMTDQVHSYNNLHKNLKVILSGPVSPNPVELLSSKRLQILMQGLMSRYDRIILDGPPYIGFADVLVLSKQVDGIVLVSSMGETSRRTIDHFRKTMSIVNGTILGCIANKVNQSKTYGYGSDYKYYQAYNNSYEEKKRGSREKFI